MTRAPAFNDYDESVPCQTSGYSVLVPKSSPLAVPRFGHSLIAGTIESFNLFGSRIKSAPLTASQFAPCVSTIYS